MSQWGTIKVIEIWQFLSYLLSCWSFRNQTLMVHHHNYAWVSWEKSGLLCLRSRSWWRFRILIVCPSDIFWTVKSFVTKLAIGGVCGVGGGGGGGRGTVTRLDVVVHPLSFSLPLSLVSLTLTHTHISFPLLPSLSLSLSTPTLNCQFCFFRGWVGGTVVLLFSPPPPFCVCVRVRARARVPVYISDRKSSSGK